MRHRSIIRAWPMLLVALAPACDDDKAVTGAGGAGGVPAGDSGITDAGGGGGGTPVDGGGADITPPPGDGGLVPCLDQPMLDRPPSGQLPCDLLPPVFVVP